MPRNLTRESYARDAASPAQIQRALILPENYTSSPKPGMPESLTIRFSRASDLETVVDLYSGERKKQIDPQSFIRPRDPDELANPVRNGSAALAIDGNGHIRAAALANIHHDGADGSNNITEVGAVLCDIGGIGLSKLVISMLTLKERFNPKASGRVYAKVARENDASNALFSRSMAWDSVCPETEAPPLFDVAYRRYQGTGKRDRLWYAFKDSAKNKAVNLIRGALDREALTGKDGAIVRLNIAESSLWSTLHFHEMLDSMPKAS